MLAAPSPPPDSTTSGYSVPCTRNSTGSPVGRGLGDDVARRLLEGADELAPDDLALRLGVGRRRPARRGTGRPRRRRPGRRRWPRRSPARPARPRPRAAARGRRRRRSAGRRRPAAPAPRRPPSRRRRTARRSPAPSPTWARIGATCSSTTLAGGPVRRAAGARRSRKFSSTRWPYSECTTSGCHCTPYSRRSSSSKAATGVPAVAGSDRRTPGGAARRSRRGSSRPAARRGWPANSVDAVRLTATAVRPYSRRPVRATVAAERLRHRLEAVADAEDRDAGLEQRRVDVRARRRVHAGRAAGQDRSPPGLRARISSTGMRVRHDLAVDAAPRAPGGRSAGRTAHRSRRRGPGGLQVVGGHVTGSVVTRSPPTRPAAALGRHVDPLLGNERQERHEPGQHVQHHPASATTRPAAPGWRSTPRRPCRSRRGSDSTLRERRVLRRPECRGIATSRMNSVMPVKTAITR